MNQADYFSHGHQSLSQIYKLYSFGCLPRFTRLVLSTTKKVSHLHCYWIIVKWINNNKYDVNKFCNALLINVDSRYLVWFFVPSSSAERKLHCSLPGALRKCQLCKNLQKLTTDVSIICFCTRLAGSITAVCPFASSERKTYIIVDNTDLTELGAAGKLWTRLLQCFEAEIHGPCSRSYKEDQSQTSNEINTLYKRWCLNIISINIREEGNGSRSA